MAIKPSALTLKSTGGLFNVLRTEIQIFLPDTLTPFPIAGVWDTGASSTAITQKVVDALGLQPSGSKKVQTANGPLQANTYMVSIGLPPNILIEGVEVTAVSLGDDCDALIGMDIISLGDLSITNFNGRTCMSFRVPSMHEIDFVNNLNFVAKGTPAIPVAKVQVGRNEPCPCGSGKKFKQCHGKGIA